ncbi:serine hydrolase domain-containing protein [Natrinema longum]|uniref:Beta-lactamase family protein n=1 Tax=Natrinema longum TaxID=370324 RepID=A0A8A2U9T4_9EURY|nr:serine hydrolase domain-containing protein [Natrinema longum]MBZ6496647.1 beta-lactamase family protein [Natrinema longum]QSW85456.1 beta-lactamase family protein [Natrinema longum]
MTRERLRSRKRGKDRPTRRRFLGGLGGIGLASLAGRASATIGSVPDSPPGDDGQFGAPDELEAFVDDVLARRIGNVTPGASVAIVEGDTPLLTKGYGEADVDTGVPVTADETPFRVGSVGKLVTYTAVMQGVERGVVELDEDVNTYLEDSAVTVPETYDAPVTLRHLGTHTAGFESALDPEVVTDRDALVPLGRLLAAHQPSRVRPPGETVGYSNYGAALAGHIVAEVHDTTFEEYVQSELFEPLEMGHSTFAQPVPDGHPGDLAAGHTRDGETFTTTDEVFINMRPAGAMSATANDMAAFMSAHLGAGAVGDTRILNADTARTMHDRHHVRHPAVTNWRYGFHEYGDPDGDLIGHSGATIDFTSQLVLAPGHDVGIFVTYNSNSSQPPGAVVDEIIAEYDLQPSPTTVPPTPGDQERAKRVAGEYSVTNLPQSGPLQVVELLARVSIEPAGNGRLLTETLDGDARQWIETKPYVYREDGGHDVLAFEVADGDVETMYLSSEPAGSYEPVPFHERQLVTGSVLGTALTGFGLSLGGWGAVEGWRRWTDRTTDSENDTEGTG